jgi:hypothetical protein
MEVFDVRGHWDAHQANGFIASFNIFLQDGPGAERLSGEASHSGGAVRSRSVEGTLRGNEIMLTVEWNNGTLGEYNGTFTPFGRIIGVTFDLNHPTGPHVAWNSSKIFGKMTI